MLLAQQQANTVIVVAILVMVLLFILVVFITFFAFFRPWLKAFLSGTPVSVFQLIGMRLRRVDTNQILTQGIAASQAGHPIPWNELEQAWLQKVDLEKVTLAYISCQKNNEPFTFQELVDAERDDRLDKMLRRQNGV